MRCTTKHTVTTIYSSHQRRSWGGCEGAIAPPCFKKYICRTFCAEFWFCPTFLCQHLFVALDTDQFKEWCRTIELLTFPTAYQSVTHLLLTYPTPVCSNRFGVKQLGNPLVPVESSREDSLNTREIMLKNQAISNYQTFGYICSDFENFRP